MTRTPDTNSEPFRIIVTGASRGIGAATALRLARPGRELVLVGRDVSALSAVARQVEERGADSETAIVDLTDQAACKAWTDELPGTVHALVHSAGVARLGRFGELGEAELEGQWALNVLAPVRITQALLPRLRWTRGTVVFVNSGAGLAARAGWGGYAASKFALRALADALRDEEDGNVRVASIFPGRTATDMQVSVRAQEGGTYDAQAYLTPEAVADAIALAVEASPEASIDELRVRPR